MNAVLVLVLLPSALFATLCLEHWLPPPWYIYWASVLSLWLPQKLWYVYRYRLDRQQTSTAIRSHWIWKIVIASPLSPAYLLSVLTSKKLSLLLNLTHLKPDLSPIYTMKNRCDIRCDRLCDRLCDRGNPCRKLSQLLIAKKLNQVQLLLQHALRHGTRHALRHRKPRSQAGRWLIMCVFHLLHWTCDKIVNRHKIRAETNPTRAESERIRIRSPNPNESRIQHASNDVITPMQ